MNEILIIKSEDLQDPKKLAFVKAIVGSKDTSGDLFIGVNLRNCTFCDDSGKTYLIEIRIKISDIKLEPRLLIGEDVEVIYDFEIQDNSDDGYGIDRFMGTLCAKAYEHYECVGCGDRINPSLQWLKENLEVVGE